MPNMFREEVHGLTDEQLDRHRKDKGWGGWSIREQVSHVAWIPYLHFLLFWGETLFGEGLPRNIELVHASGADRMLDRKNYWTMEQIFFAFDDSCHLAQSILKHETVESLRKKVLARKVSNEMKWPTGESVKEYLETLVIPAHTGGYWKDVEDPNLFHQNLESTFQHCLWEAYVHLKTIQMHKQEEGLEPVSPYPEGEGYIPRLVWD